MGNFENYPLSDNIELYIDDAIESEFISYLSNDKFIKKFRRIAHEILSNRYNDDLYGKEEVSNKSKNITAMKFSNLNNLRIYCKEFSGLGKKIVAIQFIHKKSQHVNKKITSVLENIGGYYYDFK